MKADLLAVFAITGVLAACSSNPLETLVGCYSMGTEGAPSLKIGSGDDDNFVMSVIREGNWSEPLALSALDPAGLQSIVGEAMNGLAPKGGLASTDGTFKIIEVPPESALNGQALDSPYLASFYFGSGTVYKKSCPAA